MLLFTSVLFDGRVQKEALSLTGAGYKVTVLYVPDEASEESLPDPTALWEELRRKLDGVTLVPVALWSKRLRRIPRALRRPLQVLELLLRFTPKIISQRWSAVHSHELTPAVFALLAKLFRGSPIVYDSHELEVAESDEAAKPLWLLYEKTVLRFANATLTVNQHIAELLNSRSGKHVFVVANRPTLPDFSSFARGSLKRKLGLPDSARIVMYAGNLAPWERGVERVAMALDVLPENVHFVVMGVGRVSEFRAHIQSQGFWTQRVSARVHFIPPAPPDDVPLWLSEADVSTMLYRSGSPNDAFNSPNKLFQSILACVPVLASANQTFPAVVLYSPPGPIGICCDPDDVNAIATSVSALLDPEKARTCRNNARALASAASWMESERELLAAYQSLKQFS